MSHICRRQCLCLSPQHCSPRSLSPSPIDNSILWPFRLKPWESSLSLTSHIQPISKSPWPFLQNRSRISLRLSTPATNTQSNHLHLPPELSQSLLTSLFALGLALLNQFHTQVSGILLPCAQSLQWGPVDGSHQAPQSMGSSRQEYWSGLPFSLPVLHTYDGFTPLLCSDPHMAPSHAE